MSILARVQKHAFMIASVAFVAMVSLVGFETHPAFWFDEGIMSQVAKNLTLFGQYGIQLAPGVFDTNSYWITVNYPVTLPMAVWIKSFGFGIWQARLTPLLYLLGLVIVSHHVLRRLFGTYTARLATGLLITFSPLYGNGVAVLGEVPGLFWIFSGILLLLAYEQYRSWCAWCLAALCLGLAAATKPFYLLLAPSVFVMLMVLWRRKTITFREGGTFCIFALLPVSLWILISFDAVFFTHASTSFSYFFNSYGDVSLVQNITQNLKRFVSESTPLHLLGLIVVAGVAVYKRRKEKMQPLLIMLAVFVGLSLLWYLKTPGWYRYFFSIHIILLLAFPASILSLSRRWGTLIIVALLVVQGIHLFATRDSFASDEIIRVADYVTELHHGQDMILVASKPELAYLLPSDAFLQYIYINPTLFFGAHSIPEQRPRIIVTGRDPDDFVIANQDVLENEYELSKNFGHYLVYKVR